MPSPLADLRRNYALAGLSESDADPDPLVQFRTWFDQALQAGVVEPNAMTVATVDPDTLQPSARVILLKGLDDAGFVFYTNYGSRKGKEIDRNPRVALAFLWADLERQVRVEGVAARVSREESLTYFHSRPRGSQIGAWVSRQSEVIPSRDVLEREQARLERQFANADVPLPDVWGGYRVIPSRVEFWQGRPSRLHDRLAYDRARDGWVMTRLAP